MKKELSAGTNDEQRSGAESGTSASLSQSGVLSVRAGEIKEGSFADGIRKLNTKGALIRPARLTKARAIMLLNYIDEFKRNWYCTHEDNVGEDDMQFACQWIVNQINRRWSQNELYSHDKRRSRHDR